MKLEIPACPVARFRDSNDHQDDWRAGSTHFDLEACGRRGCATVKVAVNGYWSQDVITLYIERKCDWREEAVAEWSANMGHSSGGRLVTADAANYPAPYYEAIKDDMEAETNFGMALIAAADVGRRILTHSDELEKFYQIAYAERKAKADAEKALKEAKIAADLPLGTVAASNMIREASEIGMWSRKKIVVFSRGADNPIWIEVERKQRVTYRVFGAVTSRAAAINLLAESSVRSHILQD